MSALQTLDRALAVLELIGDRPGLSASEISKVLELNRTIVVRLIWSLTEINWIRRAGDGYFVSPTSVELSNHVDSAIEDFSDLLDEEAQRLSVTLVIHGIHNRESIVLHESLPHKQVGLVVRHEVGSRTSLEVSASSLALLMALMTFEPTLGEKLLATCTNDRRGDVSDAMARGYATSQESVQVGAFGIAVPLAPQGERGVLSLAALGPVGEANRLQAMVPDLIRIAAAFSEPRSK